MQKLLSISAFHLHLSLLCDKDFNGKASVLLLRDMVKKWAGINQLVSFSSAAQE